MKNKLKTIFIYLIIIILVSGCVFKKAEKVPKGGITLYKVSGDNINTLSDYDVVGKDKEYQRDIIKHQEIWGLIKKIVVPEYRDKLKEMLIFNGEKENLDAYVVNISNDTKEWRIGVAINYAYNKDYSKSKRLEYNLVHEFAHIIALNSDQVDMDKKKQQCTSYYTLGVCTKTDSYMNMFYQEFWKDIAAEHKKLNRLDFYSMNKNKFVSEYASVSPVEDFAETFAFFITKDLPESNSLYVKDIKVLFFTKYPELMEMRDTIRNNLGY